jgi:hypothetical protein
MPKKKEKKFSNYLYLFDPLTGDIRTFSPEKREGLKKAAEESGYEVYQNIRTLIRGLVEWEQSVNPHAQLQDDWERIRRAMSLLAHKAEARCRTNNMQGLGD